MLKKVLIIGSSGHAKVIIDIFEKSGYTILGCIDNNLSNGDKVNDYEIIGNDDSIEKIIELHPDTFVFIAIGDNWIRFNVTEKLNLLSKSINFASAIHPSAQIAKGVKIGVGVAIMAGVVINSNSVIENHCIINTKASVDHDCMIGEYCSVAPGATIGGNVKIKNYSSISIGATIKNNISIGEHTVVGAGSLLLEDCESNVIVYGVPAKKIRLRKTGEKYF